MMVAQVVKYDKISKARKTWEKKVMSNHEFQLTEKYSHKDSK